MDYTSKEKRKIVQDDYNAIAGVYAKQYSDIDYCEEYIEEFIKKLSGKKVLDVGCGAGQITNYLTQRGFDAVGIDFSQELLNIAKQNFPQAKFMYADICDYTQRQKVDGIITKDVLFHLSDEDIKIVLKNFRNLLKNNGNICIIMDMPKEAGEQIFIEELDGRYQVYYNYLTSDKLKEMLEDAGFEIDGIQLIKDNDNASSYATGLMVIQANNNELKYSR